jgi:hypothetical protein
LKLFGQLIDDSIIKTQVRFSNFETEPKFT